MRAFYKLAVVQTKLFMREPPAFFFTLVFPTLVLAILGSVYGNTPNPEWNANYGFVDHETPAIMGLIIATLGLMGIPVDVASSREKKVLRRYRATPLTSWKLLLATLAVYYAMAVVGMIGTVVFAKLVFNLRFAGSWSSMLVAMTLCTTSFFSLGYMIASLAPTARIAQTVGQVIFFPMMFLSGATLPLVMLPDRVRQVAEMFPLTHAIKLLQNLWFGGSWSDAIPQVIVLLATLVIGLLAASLTFRWE